MKANESMLYTQAPVRRWSQSVGYETQLEPVPLAVRLKDDSLLANGAALGWPRTRHQRNVLRSLEDAHASFGVVPFHSIVAAVAAGVQPFYDELGRAAEGVIGPSQWEAHASFSAGIGPDAFWFLRNFRKQFRRKPEYTAAGSFAVGLIFKECVRRAGSLQDNNLLATAAELDGYTFYGRFRLDSASRRQVGHRILLIQWVRDHKVLLPTGNIE